MIEKHTHTVASLIGDKGFVSRERKAWGNKLPRHVGGSGLKLSKKTLEALFVFNENAYDFLCMYADGEEWSLCLLAKVFVVFLCLGIILVLY